MATWKCPQEWSEWMNWLAAGLHGRCRWRLPILLLGILFARGRRPWPVGCGQRGSVAASAVITTSSPPWDASPNRWPRNCFAALAEVAHRRAAAAGPRRHSHQALRPEGPGAGIHHNPTPGPADAKYVYGHIWVTLSWVVRHPLWGTIGLPLLAALYVRRKNISAIPSNSAGSSRRSCNRARTWWPGPRKSPFPRENGCGSSPTGPTPSGRSSSHVEVSAIAIMSPPAVTKAHL